MRLGGRRGESHDKKHRFGEQHPSSLSVRTSHAKLPPHQSLVSLACVFLDAQLLYTKKNNQQQLIPTGATLCVLSTEYPGKLKL